jgi:CBS-domain-containing membrane protein
MSSELKSIEPSRSTQTARRQIGWRGELVLILLPTVTVLVMLGMVQVLTEQRLLFASLASSAFLIYLDPKHGTNEVRTLILSQLAAAVFGLIAYLALGPGYGSAASAMVVSIAAMLALDAIHPPAVATSLSFALRAGDETNVMIFGLAVGITATLVVLERATLWLLTHYTAKRDETS